MYSDGLESYLRLASLFEFSLVTGAYAECATILDQMERDFGPSLWLIKSRILLLQSTEGLDSQKQYALKTKQDSIENGVVSFLTHFFSYRMEPSVSAGYFARQFENVLSNLRIPEGFKSFARYHVLSASMHSTEALGAILRYASGASAVDYLEAFLTVCRMVLATDGSGPIPALSSALRNLASAIGLPPENRSSHSVSFVG